MATSTVSPADMGPTPAGVPVGMRSPGSSVMAGRDVDQQVRDGEEEVARGAVLLALAVEAGFDDDAGGGIDFAGDERAAGAEGVEALGARPLAVLFCRSRAVTSFTMV